MDDSKLTNKISSHLFEISTRETIKSLMKGLKIKKQKIYNFHAPLFSLLYKGILLDIPPGSNSGTILSVIGE